MKKHVHHNALRAALSADDLRLVLHAISAYAHNDEYGPLYGRLQVQAAALGVAYPGAQAG